MRRNAISIVVLSVLLGSVVTGTLSWNAASVPNEAPSATGSTETVKEAATQKRVYLIPSKKKRRRATLAAAAPVVLHAPTPAPAKAVAVEAGYHPAVDFGDISEKHKKIATAVLNALPSGCRDHLKNFSVMYKGATRRGLGGKTTIILDGSVPDDEFAALLVHECAHVINANLQGTADAGDSGYRDGKEVFYKNSPAVAFWSISWSATGIKKPAMKDADFVSGYAKSDQYEDFAETFAAYVLQRDMLVEQATKSAVIASKLAWMDAHLGLKAEALGDGSASWTGTVPWDITKLAFAFSGQ